MDLALQLPRTDFLRHHRKGRRRTALRADRRGKDLTRHQQAATCRARIETIPAVHHRLLERLSAQRTRKHGVSAPTEQPDPVRLPRIEPNRGVAVVAMPGGVAVEQLHRGSAVRAIHGM